jgi:hypothetical protein
MQHATEIDVARAEAPRIGEKFVFAAQENSEILGLLEDGRSFRLTAPSARERDLQQESRPLTIRALDLHPAEGGEARLRGRVFYE